jgi:hypothetical protein
MTWQPFAGEIVVYALGVACICLGAFAKDDLLEQMTYRDGSPASPLAVRVIAITSGIGGIIPMYSLRSSKITKRSAEARSRYGRADWGTS